ncbi:hypothetical protein AB0E96_07835 [Kitasatospora sp. NPDC036755]|uniref:hypothetical protein n=1 Tax=Kitasatospora sp. NPDC036755 TaxID=3154600 RepID=UPI0033EE1F1F
MREADFKAQMAGVYAQGTEPRLLSVLPTGRDEMWAVGNAMFIIPVVPPDAPPLLEYALRLRREATFTGKCGECNATFGIGAFGNLEEISFSAAKFPHRRNCPAADDNVLPNLQQHYDDLSRRTIGETLNAINSSTRKKVEERVVNRVDVKGRKFEAWARSILDKRLTAEAPRCGHLETLAAQTWNLLIGDTEWRCDQCYAYLRQSALDGKFKLGDEEEFTCDYCRNPTDRFEPIAIRINHFFMTGAVCPTCAKMLQRGDSPKKVSKRGKNRRKHR